MPHPIKNPATNGHGAATPVMPGAADPPPQAPGDVAAIVDLGSASACVMVVRRSGRSGFDVLARAKAPLRLAASLDASGRLGPAAIERTVEAFGRFAALMSRHGVQPASAAVCAVATEALRQAHDAPALCAAVEAATGIRIAVIDGATEGALVFTGMRMQWRRGALLGLDIGGGSTELVYGEGRAPKRILSLPIGALVASRRLGLGDDAVSQTQLDAARAAIDEVVAAPVAAFGAGLSLGALASAGRAIGTSGSIQRIASAIAAQRVAHSGSSEQTRAPLAGPAGSADIVPSIDRLPLTLADLRALMAALAQRDREERLRLPGMDPGRVDSLLAGAIVLERVTVAARIDCWRVGLSGLRNGLCAVALGRAEDWRRPTAAGPSPLS